MTDTFQDLVQRLTRPHTRQVQRDAGTTVVEADGLLTQLRAAVFGGMGGSGGSQFGSKLPLDVAAADLLDEIDRQAAEALASVSHTVTPYGTTESYVRLWAGQTTETKLVSVSVKQQRELRPEELLRKPIPAAVWFEQQQMSSYDLLNRWVNRIEDYFMPARLGEIKAPCPVCEVQFIFRKVEGQTIKSRALNFTRDENGDTTAARCSSCTRSWPPSQFGWLATTIGLSMEDMLAQEPSKPKRVWGEKTNLPEGSYRRVGEEWVDALTGNRFPVDA